MPALTARAGGPWETCHNGHGGHPSPSLQPSPLPPLSECDTATQPFPIWESKGVGEHTLPWCICVLNTY